jgi:hypothetical protein
MAESTVSRRLSEFSASRSSRWALIWLISLVTYEPTDPVWFFTTDALHPPVNFVGRVGAFVSSCHFNSSATRRISSQGSSPGRAGIYFWCQPFEAIYTKAIGVGLFLGCSSAFLSLVLGSADVAGKTFEAGGSLGAWLGSWFAEYLNRTGSIIVLLTLMVLAVILSTQFSFGRDVLRTRARVLAICTARSMGFLRAWFEDRRKQKQRREVIAKHTKKEGASPEKTAAVAKRRETSADEPAAPARCREEAATPRSRRRFRCRNRSREGAAAAGRLHAAAAVAARPAKAEQKIDERELMDAARQLEEKCREFAVEGRSRRSTRARSSRRSSSSPRPA